MAALEIIDIDRPDPKAYFAPADAGLLEWDTLIWRFATEKSYWLASADGKPHSMPVWGIWHDNTFKFSTSGASRKAKNLRANPFAVVHTANTEATLILECHARELIDPAELQKFVDEYNPKYKWAFSVDDLREGVFALSPRKAFAWTGGEGDAFTHTATRWTFKS